MKVIPEHILKYANQTGTKLHNQDNHPICILKQMIFDYFGSEYTLHSSFDPEVSTWENFDALLIPEEHPSRSESDTFYITENSVLATHTSAFQHRLLKTGKEAFLVCSDAYRRDEIDRSHYPVFHQLEGVKLCGNPEGDLKKTLSGLIEYLFPGIDYHFGPDSFPFTSPSFEVILDWNNQEMEVLGCGVIHPGVLTHAGVENRTGWAFGLGLERLAMVLFDIPDIRYFWSQDERFLKQFKAGEISKFTTYSNYPPVYKDVSFWIDGAFSRNEMFEIVREIAGDLIESVDLIDTFEREGRKSECFRMAFRSNDRVMTNEEINDLNDIIRESLNNRLSIQLR